MEPQNNSTDPGLDQATSLPPPAAAPKNRGGFSRFVTSSFKTKGAAVLWIILSAIIFQYVVIGAIINYLPYIGPIAYLIFFAFWIIVIFILRTAGYKKEAANIGKALGTVLLIIIILAIIGFGVCLLLLSGWN